MNFDFKTCEKPVSQVEQIFQEELEKLKRQEKKANDAARKEATHENQDANTNNINLLNVFSTLISTAGPSIALNDYEPSYPDDPSMPHLEDIYASPNEGIFTDSSYDDEGVVIDFNNLETTIIFSLIPTTRIHTIHPKTQILGDPLSAVQTRSKVHKNSKAHALKEDGIFISQDKYVAEILKKFDFLSLKTASTPIDTRKPLVKDEEAADVDSVLVLDFRLLRRHLTFKQCKGSLDISKANQNWVFGILKRLISWQSKKQTIMATSTIEAEYVAVAHCCGQVL
nr:copia protein [Tanacetum cinerariifolium]